MIPYDVLIPNYTLICLSHSAQSPYLACDLLIHIGSRNEHDQNDDIDLHYVAKKTHPRCVAKYTIVNELTKDTKYENLACDANHYER